MKNFALLISLLLSLVFCGASTAYANPELEDFSFLEGKWRGGDGDFVFEEIWSAAEGGVMTAMARGVSKGELRVLEYIVLSEEDDQLVMRFKHFNADYSTWEGEAPPLELTLTKFEGTDALFTADPPTHTVKSIRYWMPDANTLQVEAEQVEDGKEKSFSLVFKRVE